MSVAVVEQKAIAIDRPTYLGTRLGQVLGRLGLSQSEFAEMAGVDRPWLARVINGEREPGPDLRARVITALQKIAPDLQEGDVFIYADLPDEMRRRLGGRKSRGQMRK